MREEAISVSKTTSALLGLLTAAVLLVLAIIAAAIGFSWFADSTEVSATGMNVTAKGDLQIRNVSEGIDIGVIEPTETMKKINLSQDPSKLTDEGSVSPGSSGSFSFYVYNPRRSNYDFACDMEIVNNQFAENHGFYNGTSKENQTLALQYANSHIMLFTSKDNGVYSGWIAPGEPLELTATNHEQMVTVYWVWVPFYDNIFDNDSYNVGGVEISEKDRTTIREYYADGMDDRLAKMFGQRGKTSVGYNEADFIFGSTIQRICFDVYVREV